MPDVVSNTTPLQYLHQIGLLDVLPRLFGSILVPSAVAGEIAAGVKIGVELPDIPSLDWVEVREVAPSPWPVPRDIHRGEAEAIALGASLHDALLLLDDLAARRHAKLSGVRFTGTLEILVKAKHAGLIESVSTYVVRLEDKEFHLAPSTRKDFLFLAGE